MGLLSAPFLGLLRVFEEVADQADQELYGDGEVKAELMDIYQKLEAGSLTEDEFDRREAELVERLEAIEERQHSRRGRSQRVAR